LFDVTVFKQLLYPISLDMAAFNLTGQGMKRTFYEAVKLVEVGYFLDEDDSFWAKWFNYAHSLNNFLDGTAI